MGDPFTPEPTPFTPPENVVENASEPVGIGAELAVDEGTHMLRLKRVVPTIEGSKKVCSM